MKKKHPIMVALVATGLALLSCRKPHAKLPAKIAPTPSTATTAAQATHDRKHPAIECPLAQRGINTAHLRPFDDIEKYVAFLERPDRDVWQRPDAVVEALGLAGNETVADIGAGSGYFSFRLAKALPSGEVIATDIEPEMVRHMHHKAVSEGIKNLQVTLGKPDDPGVPTDANLVFVCDVLHHVSDRAAWLGRLAAGMSTGARLVLIEFKEGPPPEGPPENVKIPERTLISLVTHAGLALVTDKPDLLSYQTFLIFRKP